MSEARAKHTAKKEKGYRWQVVATHKTSGIVRSYDFGNNPTSYSRARSFVYTAQSCTRGEYEIEIRKIILNRAKGV